jgi:GNAT superfamily N-acetyltransferase
VEDELATALASERAIVRRAVATARDIEGGWVVGHPPLPDIWHLNRIHLTGRRSGGIGAAELEALVARELSGVPHRRVTVDDGNAAGELWPDLEDRGWRRERAVVMVRDRSRSDLPAPSGATAIRAVDAVDAVAAVGEAQLRAFQLLAFADDAGASTGAAELPARLVDTQTALRAGTRWRALGAGTAAGGLPLSTATVYLDPDVGGRRVAFVDQVVTLRAHRERGLARAVMAAVLRVAADWDAGLVALFADADDWPQVFYASLGFGMVGRQTVFHRGD